MTWYMYVIECENGSLYTGISNDVLARYQAHCSGRGARYTRANPPKHLAMVIHFENHSAAAKAEYAFKQLSPSRKRQLCAEHASSLAAFTSLNQ